VPSSLRAAAATPHGPTPSTPRKHPTHAFSCQRLEDYRSFLRIKVERDGALTVYPVGVRKVPRKWRLVKDRGPHEPLFEPVDRPLSTHLIEAPIRIEP
jgi:hypothetical protein